MDFQTYGKQIAAHYPVVNRDCYAKDLVPIGRLKTGKTVKNVILTTSYETIKICKG